MAALSNIRTNIPAEQLRRKWRKWAREALSPTVELNTAEESRAVERLKDLKANFGAAHSYECSSASLSALCASMLEFAFGIGIGTFIAVLGDHRVPAAIRLRAKDLPLLLEEVAARDETVVLAPESLDGMIVIDVTRHGTSNVDLLISGSGTLVDAIKLVANLNPGGRFFAGN